VWGHCRGFAEWGLGNLVDRKNGFLTCSGMALYSLVIDRQTGSCRPWSKRSCLRRARLHNRRSCKSAPVSATAFPFPPRQITVALPDRSTGRCSSASIHWGIVPSPKMWPGCNPHHKADRPDHQRQRSHQSGGSALR